VIVPSNGRDSHSRNTLPCTLHPWALKKKETKMKERKKLRREEKYVEGNEKKESARQKRTSVAFISCALFTSGVKRPKSGRE